MILLLINLPVFSVYIPEKFVIFVEETETEDNLLFGRNTMLKWLKPEYCIHKKLACDKCEKFIGSTCSLVRVSLRDNKSKIGVENKK